MKIILILLILSGVCYGYNPIFYRDNDISCWEYQGCPDIDKNGKSFCNSNDTSCLSNYRKIKFPKYKCDQVKICIKYDANPKGTINAGMKICSEYELESGMICEPIKGE